MAEVNLPAAADEPEGFRDKADATFLDDLRKARRSGNAT